MAAFRLPSTLIATLFLATVTGFAPAQQTPPQVLNVTAANVSVVAGASATLTYAQLLSAYSAPGLTTTQLQAALANAEVGVTISGYGYSYNIPITSYGTYYGPDLIPVIAATDAPGTYTMTPYITGSGASNFTFSETPGSLTITTSSTKQVLDVTAANVSVVAGAPATLTYVQLLIAYSAPGVTPEQLQADLANVEVGVTISGAGYSYNIPILSYGTYYGDNLIPVIAATDPAGTYTMTPYMSGPGSSNFTFNATPGSLTIVAP